MIFPKSLVLTLLACSLAHAAGDEVVSYGIVKHIQSEALGEKRTLNIYLPPGYEEEKKKLPVIYLLDGSAHEDYHHVTGLVQFLTMYNLMPRSIFVGIANVDRYRDFTHETKLEEHKKRLPTSGGSAKFRKFIAKELQPYINKNYRTNGTETIIGQSLGGLLATELFVKDPDLFDNYMIVSPSLWWDEGTVLKSLAQSLQDHPKRKGKVIISVGTEGPEMEGDVKKMVALFKEHAPKKLKWDFIHLPKESHDTILHRALYRGFETFYGDTHKGL